MDIKRLGGQIAEAGAHLLGTAVGGGRAGDFLGSIVGSVFGVDDPTPDNLAKAIAADPESSAKLLKIQNDHQEKLQQIAADRALREALEQTKRLLAEVDDRKSARVMHTDDKTPQLILTTLIVIGFFSALTSLAMGAFTDAADSQAGQLMVGALISQFGAAMAFWFGSTRDSQRKTAALFNRQP